MECKSHSIVQSEAKFSNPDGMCFILLVTFVPALTKFIRLFVISDFTVYDDRKSLTVYDDRKSLYSVR